ncbi:MAG: efflux RND transporter periplasmic adaptor subunit [Terrimicrobiaceae bacterium]|nr:efflux RND transporter periplasmic adaptor subunit [Terrimicrobiaceae bacterium]
MNAFLIALVPFLAVAPASVTTVRPELPPAHETLRLPARTAPAEQAEIFSRATGIVRERRVDIGDTVKAGDILAVIDAPEVRRSVERAAAGVTQARARAELAAAALERAQAMSKNRVIAAETLDERQAAFKTTEADLLAAQAELKRWEEQERFLTIIAPFDGIVSARRIDRGDHIRGDQSTAGHGLFEIVRLDTLRVEVNAPPSAALRLKVGQKAAVDFPELPGRSFEAVVARSSGVLDPASGTMRFELSLNNPNLTLPAGLTGTAAIEVNSPAVVLVPTNGVVTRDGRPHIARLNSGVINFVPVEVGRNLGQKIEILSGITESDEIIISPNALWKEGDRPAS